MTQNISHQAVRQVAKFGIESAVKTTIDTGIDIASGNQVTGQTLAMNFAFNLVSNGAGSTSTKKAPKADVQTNKPKTGSTPVAKPIKDVTPVQQLSNPGSKNKDFDSWLNKGTADNSVYHGIDSATGDAVYTGITKQGLEKRLVQHNSSGKDFFEIRTTTWWINQKSSQISRTISD